MTTMELAMPTLKLLHLYPFVYLSLVALFSLMIGSFLNVVIYRIPKMLNREWRCQCAEFLECDNPKQAEDDKPFNLCTPASTCPHCGTKITIRDNIPVLSYLLLRGRCRACKAGISPRYPLVELLTMGLALSSCLVFGLTAQMGFALILGYVLIALTFIDIDTQLLPDNITLPLMWLGIVINYFGVYTSLQSAVMGAVAGYMSLWTVMMLFKLVTGKDGMGHGDFKLFAAIGAWCGWQMLPLTIMLASLLGAILGTIILRRQKQSNATPIPFGPYLALAGWIALHFGHIINHAYLSYAGLA